MARACPKKVKFHILYISIKLLIKFSAKEFPVSVRRSSSIGPVSHGKNPHDPSRQRREAASSNMEEESTSLEELKKLKVVELKARLSSLGLHTSGRLVNCALFSLRLTD